LHLPPGNVGFDAVRGCARCGQENPDNARFCNACGNPLTEPAATSEERRVVSVVFVDLVGFTSRAERLDPEDVRAILTPYYERVRSELEGFGGRVEKFIGDAVMGVFGAPTAFGDDHERAVRAALAVRDWAAEDGLEVRIAVNTGEAIVELEARPAHGEAMIAGDVVNTAARLQAAAPVGAVLVGEDTYASTRTWIEYQPGFQRVRAKGKADPVQAWIAVRAVAPAGERPLTPVPLVGRRRELDVLKGLWERVADERRPHLVTVFGPAGIGKSRLALELMEHAGAGVGRVLRGRASPYGATSPYSAFAQHVKQVARVYDSDEPPEARAKLASAVAELVGPDAAEEHAAHLSLLVGFGENGEVPDRETLFFSARAFVESLGSEGPTLLLFEDLHWADASLLDLLETLAARVRDVPVLFVALARPELLTQRPGWAGGLPAYTALPLDGLTADASRELAGLLFARLETADTRVASIAETAEGNPLFIEELAASVAERSMAEATELPTSIRAIIAARLDALPPEERRLLVDASVVGRVFWRGALTHLASREELSALLGSLEGRDLVRREVVSRIRGDEQYAFKHSLIRDVAYQRLPRAERRERHAAVADFLEQTTGEMGQSEEALAHHRREAGDLDRARAHLVAAADQAGRGWAKEHAVALYREALGLVSEEDEESRRDLRRRLAVALQTLYHVRDAEGLRPS
jgi:class 3 adenylate cyclase